MPVSKTILPVRLEYISVLLFLLFTNSSLGNDIAINEVLAPNSASYYSDPPQPPVFSHTSGFYTDEFILTLSHPDTLATILYTLDGSEPLVENLYGVSYNYKNQYPQNPGQDFGPILTNSYTSNSYSAPLLITDLSTKGNKLANISSTWHFIPDYFPTQPIKKATVVKARTVLNGSSSKIVTHTYFVSGNSAFNSSLPVVSISLNEDALFDYNDGIYVAGEDFDNWRTRNPTEAATGHVSSNYRRKGVGTEKAATFQYFVNGDEVINQNIGLRLHGAFSRSVQNKTFRLYARSEYDSQNSFDYPFFGETNSSRFKRLILRNSGNDAGDLWIAGDLIPTVSPAVYFRDAFIHKMVSHMRFDIQDYIPAITYVNGEYWGLLNIRERYDKHYIERKYGIHETDLELLEGNASVKEGGNDHFLYMRNFIYDNNLINEKNYNYAKTLMDTDNFMDYTIAQIYARNTDWPWNNTEYFRKRTPQYEPDAPYGQDGRWRWMMFDTDHGFGWTGGESYKHNTLLQASRNDGWSTVILNKLLENQIFRTNFINRYADLLNTAFLPGRLIDLIDNLAANIADEIPLHRERWNTLHNWEDNVREMKSFAEERPEYARSHIRSQFGIMKDQTITLDVSDTKHGYIQINSIELNESTPGVSSDPYPWTGVYFYNVPITLKAISKPGYIFSHWSGTGLINNSKAEIAIMPLDNLSIQANFVVSQKDDQHLLYFWLMDDNIQNDTPLGNLSSTYSFENTPGSITFISAYGADYPFSEDHPNWRKGSMERRNAPTPLNYYPVANNDLEYGSFDMRGLQVKQPFLGNGVENSLIFSLSTQNYENIKFSFAALDEGASDKFIVDYHDPVSKTWINSGIINSNWSLTPDYQLYNIDLSLAPLANNNPDFIMRIRFSGIDMQTDKGNRVIFNNFAFKGDLLTVEIIGTRLFSVHPNPTTNQINIITDPSLIGSQWKVHNLSGKIILSGELQKVNTILELANLPAGVYILNIGDDKKQSFKVLKQ